MTKEKLRRLGASLEKARQQAANLKVADIEKLALMAGRLKRPGGGGHLVYKCSFQRGPNLIIPNHPGKPIKRGLALELINCLEADIEIWEEWFRE